MNGNMFGTKLYCRAYSWHLVLAPQASPKLIESKAGRGPRQQRLLQRECSPR